MKVKDRIRLKIESVAFGGDGVGRHEGLVVFVPFTAPGDVIEAEILQCKKTFARGRIRQILVPAAVRTEPQCRYFGVCGGCTYQHLQYDEQLEIKRRQVQDAFGKIGKMPAADVKAVWASPAQYAYRGKATLHAARTSRGCKLGFMDVSGGDVTEIERCEIVHETINTQIGQARANARSWSDKEDVVFWSQEGDDSPEAVVRQVKGKTFWVPRDGFFQANLSLTDRMVEEVCRLVNKAEAKTVVDACCGCGLFSIFLASSARCVIGIEIFEMSVQFARRNAEKNGVSNVEFLCGDIADVLSDIGSRKISVDTILLDPPRTGLDPQAIHGVVQLKPEEIIYVSCNPATQARDVRFMVESGYELVQVQPLDMFPQTQHIESIGLLRRCAKV